MSIDNAAVSAEPENEIDTTPAPEQVDTEDQKGAGEIEFELDGDGGSGTPTDQTVPLATHIKLKQKAKERNEQNEQNTAAMRQEIELLRAQVKQQQQPVKEPEPTLEGCGYDEGLYAQKMREYHSQQNQTAVRQQIQEHFQEHTQTQTQQQQQQQAEAAFDSKLDSFATEATELNIPEIDAAYGEVANVFGQNLMKSLVSQGGFNAKSIYYLSKNPDRARAIEQKLKTDPFNAIAELGELKKLKVKQSDSPPDPAPSINGGQAGANSFENQYSRLLEQASKTGVLDHTAMAKLKKEAAAAGVKL